MVRFDPSSTLYGHAMTGGKGDGSDAHMLSDAGWHCSFCFKTIGDFVFKARAYSHTDRLGPPSMARRVLDPEHIKAAVCHGWDLFGMLPEAYTWSGLLGRWSGAGERESGGLPFALVQYGPQRWPWLLRSTCDRQWERGEEWKFGEFEQGS